MAATSVVRGRLLHAHQRAACLPRPARRLLTPRLHAQAGPSLQRLNAWDPRTWRCSLWQVDNAAATFIAERSARRPRPEVALSATLGSGS